MKVVSGAATTWSPPKPLTQFVQLSSCPGTSWALSCFVHVFRLLSCCFSLTGENAEGRKLERLENGERRRRRHTASINYKVKLKLNSTPNNASCLDAVGARFRLDLSCLSAKAPVRLLYIAFPCWRLMQLGRRRWRWAMAMGKGNGAQSLCQCHSLCWTFLLAIGDVGAQLPTETNHCDTFIKI